MIEETAQVVSVNGDQVIVEAAVKSTCSGCKAQPDCGTGAIARAFSHRANRLELVTPMPVKVGEEVVIGIREESVLVASWWLYLAPLLAFLTVNIVLSSLFSAHMHELLILALSLIPGLLSFVWVSGYLKRLDKGRFHPVILRKL